MGAGPGAGLEQARAQPLARQLQQAESADPADLDARPVGPHGFLQPFLDRVPVLGHRHVDEVDDDQTGKVPEPQLARYFIRRLEVGLVGRLLDVAFLGGAARIDVDRNQGLGRVDDDVAAGFEANLGAVHGIELALHLIAVKQRYRRIPVALDVLGVARHQHAHEFLGRAVAFLPLDEDLLDILVVEVADRPLDQIGFLIHQGGGGGDEGAFAHVVPEPEQILEVPFDFRLAALDRHGAQDDRHSFGQVELIEDALEPLAVRRVDDLARDAAVPRRVGHQDTVPPGEGEIGGERRALGASFLLDPLDEQDLAPLDDFLDLVAMAARPHAPALRLFFRLVVAADDLVLARLGGVGAPFFIAVDVAGFRRSGAATFIRGRPGIGRAARAHGGGAVLPVHRRRLAVAFGAVRSTLRLLVGGARLALRRYRIGGVGLAGRGHLGLLGQQRLPVGDGDLIVVGMDFAKGEEAVAVAAEFDERGLEGGLYPGDFRQVDIALDVFLVGAFEVEFFKSVAACDDHPGFLQVRRIDQHAFRHLFCNSMTPPPRPPTGGRRGAIFSTKPPAPPCGQPKNGIFTARPAAHRGSQPRHRRERLQCLLQTSTPS